MPTYRITITNKTFQSCADSDYGDDQEAAREAVQGAIAIAADEIRNGEPLSMAEITVEHDGGKSSAEVAIAARRCRRSLRAAVRQQLAASRRNSVRPMKQSSRCAFS